MYLLLICISIVKKFRYYSIVIINALSYVIRCNREFNKMDVLNFRLTLISEVY